MPSNPSKNKKSIWGLAGVVIGASLGLLGFAAWANYYEVCVYNPGGFPPCSTEYRVALLAPLYPMSTELTALGIIIGMIGGFVAYKSYSTTLKKDGSVSTGSSTAEPSA